MNKVITRYMITSVRIVKVAIYQIFLEAFKFTDRFKAWFRNLVTVQARPKRFPQLSQA